jgi:hypothetical protein
MTTLRPTEGAADEAGVGFEVPLRALRAAIKAYGEAISIATRSGHTTIAEVLGESLSDKGAAIIVLSSR